jgi:hypothetical protein
MSLSAPKGLKPRRWKLQFKTGVCPWQSETYEEIKLKSMSTKFSISKNIFTKLYSKCEECKFKAARKKPQPQVDTTMQSSTPLIAYR